ncbi:putative RNA-directed DNA polymerase from transposon BS [Araneus ventricosus]|uniref:Putative RNA-directed DNA polymerase from transposon BS n=1 Tax=Araneus ventricosus TaxID=182803 RepID=A0A4Y2SVQ4_ARAVE|nr:putative RNA-directed DNA polymerase from transposon BS [Araneus ventricosus]
MNFFYSVRHGRSGGGLLTGFPKSAAARVIPSPFDSNSSTEMLTAEIFYKQQSFTIINVYAPQGFDITQARMYFESLKAPIFIFGDFNLHHRMWKANSSNSLSNNFADWLQMSNFLLLNSTTPTHISHTGSQSILDLSICTADIFHRVKTFVNNTSFESDHNPVITEWSNINFAPRNIKSINWSNIMQQTSEILSSTLQDFSNTMAIVSSSIKNNTTMTPLPHNNFPPWWNMACHNFLLLKKKFKNKAHNAFSIAAWIKYKKYSSKLRRTMKKASRSYWDSICNISRNPRMFYSMLNKISNHVSQDINTSNLIIHNNRIISNPQLQSNLFVNFFALRIQHEPIPLDYNGVHNSNLNHPIQIQETIKAIQTTRNSTPGADNIPAAWFKRLNNQQVHTLTASFQKIFTTTNIPQQWKHSLIIPIPKPSKDKTIISSIRPVALTSVGAKIFERILTKRISTFLLTQKKIPPCVYGFLPLRDNQLAIYKIQSNILEAHQQKDFFIGINLDIKSAYDSVYIDGLIQKCLHIGITGYIVKFIHHFLQDRVLQVRWRNQLSKTKVTQRGLAQGSVLSPILFAIFLFDFEDTLEEGVQVSIFADDIFIYCSHNSPDHIVKNFDTQ